jgi:hypothetical protein
MHDVVGRYTGYPSPQALPKAQTTPVCFIKRSVRCLPIGLGQRHQNAANSVRRRVCLIVSSLQKKLVGLDLEGLQASVMELACTDMETASLSRSGTLEFTNAELFAVARPLHNLSQMGARLRSGGTWNSSCHLSDRC